MYEQTDYIPKRIYMHTYTKYMCMYTYIYKYVDRCYNVKKVEVFNLYSNFILNTKLYT